QLHLHVLHAAREHRRSRRRPGRRAGGRVRVRAPRNNPRSGCVVVAMSALAEQLDAMLMGWLERVARQRRPTAADLRATAVITIDDTALPDVEAVCAN